MVAAKQLDHFLRGKAEVTAVIVSVWIRWGLIPMLSGGRMVSRRPVCRGSESVITTRRYNEVGVQDLNGEVKLVLPGLFV